jgi:hypothetical protein
LLPHLGFWLGGMGCVGGAPGAPKGNKNAFKHGRYTAEAVAIQREVAALIRAMRALAGATKEGE